MRAHNATNEQAMLNAPTERTVVQRLNGEDTEMPFMIVLDSRIYWEIYSHLSDSGMATKLNGFVQAWLPHCPSAVVFRQQELFLEADTCHGA
jgi:hypothetical protein